MSLGLTTTDDPLRAPDVRSTWYVLTVNNDAFRGRCTLDSRRYWRVQPLCLIDTSLEVLGLHDIRMLEVSVGIDKWTQLFAQTNDMLGFLRKIVEQVSQRGSGGLAACDYNSL